MSKSFQRGYADDLVYTKEGEFSFEEVRASRYASERPRFVDEKNDLRMELSELRKEVAVLRSQKENLQREIGRLQKLRDGLGDDRQEATEDYGDQPTGTIMNGLIAGMFNKSAKTKDRPKLAPIYGGGGGEPSIPEVEVVRGSSPAYSDDEEDGPFMIRPDTDVISNRDIAKASKFESHFVAEPEEDPIELTTELHLPNGEVILECYSPQDWDKALDEAEKEVQEYAGFTDGDDRAPQPQTEAPLELGEWELQLYKRIGGSDKWGVWYGERVDDDSFELEETDCVVKFSEPEAAVWEFYIVSTARTRVRRSMRDHFVQTHALYKFDNAAVTVMDRVEHKDIAAATDMYRRASEHMDETLVMYYTIELLKLVHQLHQANIIHGHIRPEHVLIRNLNSDKTHLWDQWGPGDVPGWDLLGVYLIDFTRSIDVDMYSPNTTFIGAHPASNPMEQCPAMRAGRQWTFQPDYYGIASVVYYMLTGQPMRTVGKGVGSVKPLDLACTRENLQYAALWQPLFDSFLNIKDCRTLPDLEDEQHRLEKFLNGDVKRAHSVRTLLVKQNIRFYEC